MITCTASSSSSFVHLALILLAGSGDTLGESEVNQVLRVLVQRYIMTGVPLVFAAELDKSEVV